MTQIRYLAYDLRTNNPLQELPLRGVQFGSMLNQAGSFQAQLPLNVTTLTAPDVTRSMAADYLTASAPGRTVIFVEMDGVIVPDAAYLIWTRLYDPDSQSLQLGAMNLWSYFQRRIIDFNLTTAPDPGSDQLAIARAIIAQVQTNTGGNIGVAVGTEVCGVPRVRNIYAYDAKPAGEAVEQLAACDNGFDFGIDVAYDVNNVPVKTFRCSYPRRGRIFTDSGHVFETGRNIVTYKLPEDATDMADRVFGLGAGDGVDMIRSTQTRTDIIDAGYPLLDASLSLKDVSNQSNLNGQTLARVNAKALPVTIPTITVTMAGDPPIGAWIVGDDAKFVFGADPDPRKFDPRFPTRTELIYRIVGYSATPGDEGQGTVDLIVN